MLIYSQILTNRSDIVASICNYPLFEGKSERSLSFIINVISYF